jgi:hypothetical protein
MMAEALARRILRLDMFRPEVTHKINSQVG